MNAIARQERYLVCVTSNNNNKFYRMKDNGDGTFTATYGRIGANGASCSYPDRMWDAKYAEKIHKGYTDQSSTILETVDSNEKEETKQASEQKPNRKKKVIARPEFLAGVNLLSRLASFAKSFVRSNYIVRSSAIKVNGSMIRKVDDLLRQLAIMAKSGKVSDFNEVLSQIFMAIPRVMSDTRGYYAKSPQDFNMIVQRECNYIDMLRGIAKTNSSATDEIRVDNDNAEEQALEAMKKYGLKISPVSEQQEKEIKALMQNQDAHYSRAWKIENGGTREAFDKYKSTLENPNVMQLWHGSRNANIHSILCSGLQTNPNAQITGKMFGYGIYFAPSFMKSLGYTSLSGSYWAGGNSDVAYMAVFDVALGKSLDVTRYDSNYSDYREKDIRERKCNSLWAHRGNMLRNDEIIVYREDAVTIRYLVEIR